MRRTIAWVLVLFMLAWGAVAPVAARSDPSAAGAAHGESVRVIELEADAALRFMQDGEQIQDIPVVPGETVVFRIDNTASFDHSFYIGTDEELRVMGASTAVGVSDWSTGIRELEWTVPDDISGLKFGCTVPGHYYTMQGTFSEADASTAVEIPAAEATAETPAAPDESVTTSPSKARVIELEADAALRFMQDGEQIHDIPVVPGETVIFRVDNTAGFDHSFYIGTDAELQVVGGSTDTGIADWSSGIEELTWVVPDDISGLGFGCTVPGHYPLMYGCFSEAWIGPDGTVERLGESGPCSAPASAPEARRGGRVEASWAGIAVTFPERWEVDVERGPWTEPDFEGPVLVLAGYGTSDTGSFAYCSVSVHDGSDYDWSTARAWSDAALEIGGAPALYFDVVEPWGPMTDYRATFVIAGPESVFTLECSSDDPPVDRWLSIAETLEFLTVAE